jgi:hypothetical protein
MSALPSDTTDPRVLRTIERIREAIDETATLPDHDGVFELQRHLLGALTAGLRIQHGIRLAKTTGEAP